MKQVGGRAPVRDALFNVLSTLYPGCVARGCAEIEDIYALLSYKNDFSYIWNLTDHSADSLLNWVREGAVAKNVILIWDGMPTSEGDEVSVAGYVTPLDWAVACSWKIVRARCNADADTPLPELRIFILDYEPSQRPDTYFTAGALQIISHLFPWIKFYKQQREADADGRSTSIMPSSFFTDLLLTRGQMSLGSSVIYEKQVAAFKYVIRLWQSDLVTPQRRHEIGNLMAPLLLSQGLTGSNLPDLENIIVQGFPLRWALGQLIHAIGLGGSSHQQNEEYEAHLGLPNQARFSSTIAYVPRPNSVPEECGLLAELAEEENIFERRKNIRILLVDDQYRMGYQHILSAILFGDKYVCKTSEDVTRRTKDWHYKVEGVGELRCEDNTSTILRTLERSPKIDDWSKPRMLSNDPGFDILLLDLRVWGDESGKYEQLKKVVRLCDMLGSEPLRDHSSQVHDPAFEIAYEKAQAVLEKRETSGEPEVLVLLPLLISHYDPSIPIVLFSSTHQRSVVELTSHRQNIITDFTKPIATEYEGLGYKRLITSLKRALSTAVYFHETRVVWLEIVERVRALESRGGRCEFRREKIKVETNDREELDLNYVVDGSDMVVLGAEYRNTLLGGRFADSLLAVGNWVEKIIGGKLAPLPEINKVLAVKRAVLEEGYPALAQPDGNWEETFQLIWDDAAYRPLLFELIKKAAAQLEGGKLKSLEHIVQNWNQGLCKQPDSITGLNLSGLIPRSAPALAGRFFGEDEEAVKLLAPNNWLDELVLDADHATFTVVSGFRNARAHYVVRPDDSATVRSYAVWCWLWAMAGLFPIAGNPILSRGDNVGNLGLTASDYYARTKRPFVVGKTKGRGEAALGNIIEQLHSATEAGWLKVNNDYLNETLRKLVVGIPVDE